MIQNYSTKAQQMKRSELAELFKLAEAEGIISFAGGLPDPDWFLPEIDDITAQIMRDHRTIALQYGPTPGLTPVRQFIAERLTSKGMACDVPNVIITSGALQGVEIASRIFVDPGDPIIVESPTYIGSIQTFESFGADMVGIPLDEHGMRVDLLEARIQELIASGRRPKFIYSIPTFQNPTGLTLSLERRKALLEIALRYGIPVLEDDAYGELRCTGEPLPTLKALDPGEIVIHLGTFSKIFSPGVRLGWFVASPELIEKAILFKQGSDQCSSSMAQMMAMAYGRAGLIEKQVAVTVESLNGKREETLKAVARYFPKGSTWTLTEGGFYTWATVAGDIDTVGLLPRAVSQYKVAYVAGPSFYPDRQGKNQLRVCYSLVKKHLIDEGIQRLAQLFGA